MKMKLVLSLMITCAFCLQASSSQDNNNEPATEEPAPRSSSVAFADVQTEIQETPSTNNKNVSASIAELDAADLAEIARIRATVFEPPLNAEEQKFWDSCVEHRLKETEATIPIRNQAVQLTEKAKEKYRESARKIGVEDIEGIEWITAIVTDTMQPEYIIKDNLELSRFYVDLIRRKRNK